MMSSFLVNVALILAMSSAVTQFCASAFASYASNTIIFEIFGNDVSRIGWLGWLGGWCLRKGWI
jgi:LMBR1 domain-containing protein 1